MLFIQKFFNPRATRKSFSQSKASLSTNHKGDGCKI